MYLLVSERVHVANDLSGHLASVSGPILEGSLDDRHDEGQGRGVDEVHKLGVQQRLKAHLGLSGRISEGVEQDGRDGLERNDDRILNILCICKTLWSQRTATSLLRPESLTQDFRVADDRANLPQGLLASLLYLHVRVSQDLGQFGHNAGQAGGQLFGGTESHGTQQLHRAWKRRRATDKQLKEFDCIC